MVSTARRELAVPLGDAGRDARAHDGRRYFQALTIPHN
eukprot:SAG31_NODE_36821_length_310_cov_0.545024_1_plen_37_part_10